MPRRVPGLGGGGQGGGGGSVASDTIWDAKGDLAAATGADAAAKLTVGSNGSILVPNSSASNGLAWIRPPVQEFGASAVTNSVFYCPLHYANNTNNATNGSTANNFQFAPMWFPEAKQVTGIVVECSTLESGATIRLGLYAMDSALYPTTRLADYGTVSGTTTGVKTATGSTTVGPGWIAIGIAHSNHSTVRWIGIDNFTSTLSPYGYYSEVGRRRSMCYVKTGTDYTGSTLPDPAPASMVFMRAQLEAIINVGVKFV